MLLGIQAGTEVVHTYSGHKLAGKKLHLTPQELTGLEELESRTPVSRFDSAQFSGYFWKAWPCPTFEVVTVFLPLPLSQV